MAITDTSSQVDLSPSPVSARAGRRRTDILPLYALAACLIIASTSWFLLKELAPSFGPSCWPSSWPTSSSPFTTRLIAANRRPRAW